MTEPVSLAVRPTCMPEIETPTVPDLCDCSSCEVCGVCMCDEQTDLACNMIACHTCHWEQCPDKSGGCWDAGFSDDDA